MPCVIPTDGLVSAMRFGLRSESMSDISIEINSVFVVVPSFKRNIKGAKRGGLVVPLLTDMRKSL